MDQLIVEGVRIDGEVRVADATGAAQLRQYVSRRLRSALRPFRERVGRVTVRVIDVNGPKGGVDTRCTINLELQSGQHVFVHAISARPHAAISLAARRLTRIIGRIGKRTGAAPGQPARDNDIERRESSA